MDALRLTHLQENLKHLSERVGRIELDLYGSGESIQVRIAKLEITAANCEDDAKEDFASLISKVEQLNQAVNSIEMRLSRRKENAELRQWIDFLGSFPGGVKGLAIAAVVAVAIIDLAVDATGLAVLLQRILGG